VRRHRPNTACQERHDMSGPHGITVHDRHAGYCRGRKHSQCAACQWNMNKAKPLAKPNICRGTAGGYPPHSAECTKSCGSVRRLFPNHLFRYSPPIRAGHELPRPSESLPPGTHRRPARVRSSFVSLASRLRGPPLTSPLFSGVPLADMPRLHQVGRPLLKNRLSL
jgi:hypothetical protein